MKPVSDVVCTVVDHGLFLPIALKLAEQMKHVYYFSPVESMMPKLADGMIGEGFDNLTRINSPWEAEHADLFVFPDIGFGPLQKHLREMGKPVWGHNGGDILETHRGRHLMKLNELEMDLPPFEIVKGMANLRAYLKDVEDKYIKISKWRGDWETFHWRSWCEDEGALDQSAYHLGPGKELITFYVFDAIDTDIEDGIDTYCIDGQWPKLVVHGMERKDKGFLCAVQEMDKISKAVTIVNDLFGPVLGEYGYRGFFSSEVRIKDEFSYFIDPTCFSDDTEVLTDRGWKKFQDLDRTERICTLNPVNSEIEYQIPEAYVSYQYSGEMVRITNRKKDLDLMVTPNHSVWGVSKHDYKLGEFRADQIPYSLRIPITGVWHGIEAKTFTIPSYSNTWHSGKGKGIDKTVCRAAITVDMDSWLRFLAIYLSEGSSRKWQTIISQTKHKSEIRQILNDTPFKWTEQRRSFTCSDVQLCSVLTGLGNRYTKSIPSFIGQLSPYQIDLFLTAYCLGDGHMDNGNRVITTPSKQTADDLQELFLKAGSLASVNLRNFKGKPCAISGGKYICQHDSYEIRERKEFQFFYVEGWKNKRHHQYLSRVPYEGMVHDVTVHNHIIYVRRNGKCCWSGNCRAGSPPSQVMCELFGNFGEIIWQGANGNCIDPEPTARFGVQSLITCHRDKDEWVTLDLPEELKPWVKCGFATLIDDVLRIAPNPLGDMIGWLCATGNTVEEAINNIKVLAKGLPCGVDCDISSLATLLREMEEAKREGVVVAEDIPEPAIAVEEA